MRKASIDVGSNSVLLLVEESNYGAWKTIHEATDVTSLGAGTKNSGLLSEEGMSNTLVALKRFYDQANELHVESIDAAATMAARIASNTADFLARAERQNTPVKVLSGEDEAQLGFEAVSSDPFFAKSRRLTIIDVGGQSTEILTASQGDKGWETLFKRSFPIGTLALKGSLLKEECPDSKAIMDTVVELDDAIGMCYRRGMCGDAVVLGATGTNLVSIREQLEKWDPEKVNGQWLLFGEISESAGNLMKLTEKQRSELIGIEPGREATLPAGALILERVLNAIGAPGSFVSTRGWRHALLEQGWPKA